MELRTGEKYPDLILEKVEREIEKFWKRYERILRNIWFRKNFDDELEKIIIKGNLPGENISYAEYLQKLNKSLELQKRHFRNLLLEKTYTKLIRHIKNSNVLQRFESHYKNPRYMVTVRKEIIDDLFYTAYLIIDTIEFGFDSMIKEYFGVLNKDRSFDIRLLKKMKYIEATVKPKPKQIQCLILANQELSNYSISDLIDTETGNPTQLAYSIIDAYKSQKPKLDSFI